VTLDEFLRRVESLRRDRARGPAKPYKPLLLAAVIAQIEKGEIADGRILLDGGLKAFFDQLLRKLYPEWPYRADIRLPFRHLENDGIWDLVPRAGARGSLGTARALGAKAVDLLRSVACARFKPGVFEALAASGQARLRVLHALACYLPPGAIEKFVALLAIPSDADSTRDAGGRRVVGAKAELLEREVEEFLWRRWRSTPFSKDMGIALCSREVHGYHGRQLITPVSAIDLLGYRPSAREWWVFELKKGRPSDAVVGQIGRYVEWLKTERPGREAVRGAIVAGDVDRKLILSARACSASVWTYDQQLRFRQVEGGLATP